jgi:Double zinc ribbon
MAFQHQLTAASSSTVCGSCSHHNPSDSKFCEGCGQPLYESCGACAHDVLLTQKFCRSCGADLEEALKARFAKIDAAMIKAVEATKRQDFGDAISLLRGLGTPPDYRFAEAAQNATVAISKIEALRDRATKQASDVQSQAQAAYDRGDQAETARLLATVPEKLLDENSRALLGKTRVFTKQLQMLQAEVRTAIAEKRWNSVGSLLNQLLEFSPHDSQYLQLAGQVSAKLIAQAKQRLARGEYEAATQHLASVPQVAEDDSVLRLRNSLEDIHWLSKQFECEPYVSPMLGRLAVSFAKEVPEDSTAKKLVQELGVQLKQASRPAKTHLPTWKASTKSWVGGDARILSLPSTIDLGDHQELKLGAGRFNVAFGLALQGLGHCRVDQHFASTKKSLFAGIGRKGKKKVWGIDLGAAAMKAVLLEESEDGKPVVVDCHFAEYSPTCRGGKTVESEEELRHALEYFIESKQLDQSLLTFTTCQRKEDSRAARTGNRH